MSIWLFLMGIFISTLCFMYVFMSILTTILNVASYIKAGTPCRIKAWQLMLVNTVFIFIGIVVLYYWVL